MAGRGDVARPRTQARGRQQHQTPSLPFDIMLEIAACSDPATLVRMAATCREVRRRIADDPTFRGRLRLRRTDRFVLPLLRGHFARKYNSDTEKEHLCLVDTTEADATRLIRVARGFGNKNLRGLKPVSLCEGLLLIRAKNRQSNQKELCVCDPATRRSQILPCKPFRHSSEAHLVLLVGEGENGDTGDVGRPFQVTRARLVTSEHCRSSRCLQIHTFSSEHGIWSPFTEIPTPNLLGKASNMHRRPLVTNDVVHWLCLTDRGSYVLMLHVKAERVTLTTLPARFPRVKEGHISYLLATDSVCGNPIVLVADEEKISMWVQSKHTKRWKEQPQVVIRNEEILRFNNVGDLLAGRPDMLHVELVWFSGRSGVVLIKVPDWCFFWLDLQSKKIVRWLSDPQLNDSSIYCPYEKEFSSWVPTFTSKF